MRTIAQSSYDYKYIPTAGSVASTGAGTLQILLAKPARESAFDRDSPNASISVSTAKSLMVL